MNEARIIGGWHRLRAATLGSFATLLPLGAAVVTWQGMLHDLHALSSRGAVRTLDALPVLLWAALLLALLWAALLIVFATASILRTDGGGRPHSSGPGGPRPGSLVTRTAGLLLALTTLSSISTAAPAFAAPSAAPATQAIASNVRTVATASDSCADDVPVPGWVPDKPPRTDQIARECTPLVTGRAVTDDSGEVVVHRGDTLWSIAAAHLGPYADARTIAAEWPRWYAANRQLVGDDPDVLTVGIRLRVPGRAMAGSAR